MIKASHKLTCERTYKYNTAEFYGCMFTGVTIKGIEITKNLQMQYLNITLSAVILSRTQVYFLLALTNMSAPCCGLQRIHTARERAFR